MRSLTFLLVLFITVLLNGGALPQELRLSENLRHEQVLLPDIAPDRNSMAAVEASMLLEDDALGIFILYDDPGTRREIDYIEFYDVAGDLLLVTWIDRFGIRYVAVDRGLLTEGAVLEGEFVLVGVGCWL